MKTQGSVTKYIRSWRFFLSSCAIAVLAPYSPAPAGTRASPDLLDARAVLGQIKQSISANAPASSETGELVAEIKSFRATSSALKPEEAAVAWFGLYDRASKIGAQAGAPDLASYDADLRAIVGVQSVIAALPEPAAWPALRDEARKRALRSVGDYQAPSLELLAAILLRDREATDLKLKSIDTAIAALPPDSRAQLLAQVTEVRNILSKLYGDPSQITRAFLSDVAEAANSSLADMGGGGEVQAPDLVTLVGEAEAAKIIKQVLTQPVVLNVESGDATRSLAGRIALENVDKLKLPQWSLVDSIDAAPLYVALQRRFAGPLPTQDSSNPSRPSSSYAKEQADTYYLLWLLVNGRQTEAQKALESIAGTQRLTIPKPAIRALQEAHQNETLYAFLSRVLADHPEVQAWDVYIEQAAYTGHSREALATLDSVLKRLDLPTYLRADLQRRRADALLAVDDVPGALKAFADMLHTRPSGTDQYAEQRASAALRLAGLGRVLNIPDAGINGLQFVRDTLALPAEGSLRAIDRGSLLRSFFAEARKQHRETDVQQVAIAELRRRDPNADPMAQQMEVLGMPGGFPTRRAALVELVSLYAAANRPADVRALLDEAEGWGARDLRDLLDKKDSGDVPLALSAARALAATGEGATAVRVATATIAQYPGYDGGYELESSIDPDAVDVFDAQLTVDQFEERPLIWKAVVLARSSKLSEAEQAIRAAIAIDPSDGEEGVNDRMRAYSVLADILEARGDAQSAKEYRKAVEAIRISERSDELYGLGLYQRAFVGYREALSHFSDAYCIQSRLAVQLSRQGQHKQAAEHYRRAYELMPVSFGRVESHCFGCESVFEGAQQQSIAETVFQSLAKKDPGNPRVHYLLGYLLEEQGRYNEALPALRQAVQIDGSYLNAWRHLHQLGDHIYLDAADRDVVTLKLLQLDPQQRHVTYNVGGVGDFELLWNTAARVNGSRGAAPDDGSLYSLKQSAKLYDEKQAELPAELRNQIQEYQALAMAMQSRHRLPTPALTLGTHGLLVAIARLLGDDDNMFWE